MNRYVTIDDATGAFLHVDDIRGCIPVDLDKQVESGYQTIIITPTRDVPSPLGLNEVRERVCASSTALAQPHMAARHSTH